MATITEASFSNNISFVRTITGCTSQHWIELRGLRSEAVLRSHFHPGDPYLGRWLRDASARGLNTYFGVAPRTEAGKGGREHCAGLHSLFADIDYKMTPPDLANERLRNFRLPPSAVVETGGGFHPYWLLTTFLPFPKNFERARSLLRRLAIAIGGDLASAEPVRILRLPNSRNFKYEPPRRVRLVDFDPNARYDIADFEDVLSNVSDDRQIREIKRQDQNEQPVLRTGLLPRDSDLTEIERALSHIAADDRETWLCIGMALHDHLGSSGREIWDTWSQTSSKFDERGQARTWQHFKSGAGITIGTLYKFALDAGWRASPQRRRLLLLDDATLMGVVHDG